MPATGDAPTSGVQAGGDRATSKGQPLITLTRLRREYPSGDGVLAVLKDVDLSIYAGEMVAIVGASGSGKSTLMNILGCLDTPSSGSYRISGRETAALSPDELAQLRREHFGFIFQRYNLLPELSAAGNVEVPAIYAGRPPAARSARAASLLQRLGMGDRLGHRPGQLSGGQQQRVSIARALMNGGEVILADEPTGALDSHSGQEVLRILDELHAGGKTIIIVTHDMGVARRAERIIEISDGIIISDRPNTPGREPAQDAMAGASPAPGPVSGPGVDAPQLVPVDRDRQNLAGTPLEQTPEVAADSFASAPVMSPLRAALSRLGEAFRMAVLAMAAHRLRAFLTMLGIIIGIASVVCVVALGEGSRQKVLSDISGLGTNTLEVFAGRSFGDTRSGKVTTLVVDDAEQLARQNYVAAVTPTVSTSQNTRFAAAEASALINGVSEQYFAAKGVKLVEGALFDRRAVQTYAQDAVIDENTRRALFDKFPGSPVGQVIIAGKTPLRVVGVVGRQQGGFGSSQNPSIFVPYTTVQARIVGGSSLRSITVRVRDDIPMDLAEKAVTRFLERRHGQQDFFIINTDDIRQTITAATQTLTLLIAAIAVISLIVGGIGVMNIMLVSVSERVSEIGVRMAVGARQSDILQQFLIEAVLVCLIGGVLGIALALGFGEIFSRFSTDFRLIYSTNSIIAAVAVSSIIGIVFGWLPARNASRLNTVTALAQA